MVDIAKSQDAEVGDGTTSGKCLLIRAVTDFALYLYYSNIHNILAFQLFHDF